VDDHEMKTIKVGKKSSGITACVLILVTLVTYSSPALSWSDGNRVHVVVLRGSTTRIESGYISTLDGDMCRVKWDQCDCETVVPVENLHRSLSAALKAGKKQDTADISFDDAAKSAGKMGLLYLLLSERGGS